MKKARVSFISGTKCEGGDIAVILRGEENIKVERKSANEAEKAVPDAMGTAFGAASEFQSEQVEQCGDFRGALAALAGHDALRGDVFAVERDVGFVVDHEGCTVKGDAGE